MTDDSLLKSRIPLPAALATGCVLVGATFGLMVYVSSTQVDTLKVQRDDALAKLNQSYSVPPPPTRAAVDQPQEVAELSSQIETLEEEKKILVSRLVDLSRDALDPRSELGVLTRQLSSENAGERMAAATGLFAINDPGTVQTLIDYYWKHQEESGRVELAMAYMRHAVANDRSLGVDFVIDVLESGNELAADQAFLVLNELARGGGYNKVDFIDFDETVRPALENVALRSEDPLVRIAPRWLCRIATNGLRG